VRAAQATLVAASILNKIKINRDKTHQKIVLSKAMSQSEQIFLKANLMIVAMNNNQTIFQSEACSKWIPINKRVCDDHG